MSAIEQQYFSVPEAADYLRCHVQRIRAAIAHGELIPARMGRRFVFCKQDLDSWFQQLKAASV